LVKTSILNLEYFNLTVVLIGKKCY
jgi:hypothetical protein